MLHAEVSGELDTSTGCFILRTKWSWQEVCVPSGMATHWLPELIGKGGSYDDPSQPRIVRDR